MKTQQKMMGQAVNSLDRCCCELKSIMNHSDDLNPGFVAEVNRIYNELGMLYGELEALTEEL